MSVGYRWRGSGDVLKGIEYTEFPAQVKSFPANEEYITKARAVVRDMDIQGGDFLITSITLNNMNQYFN
jgi:hypothetical protein